MKRNKINILGLVKRDGKTLATTWVKGLGLYTRVERRDRESGGKERQRGVGVLLDESTARNVIKVTQHSDRFLLVKLDAEPVDIVVIQVYNCTCQQLDIVMKN